MPKCSRCGKSIEFVHTSKGKTMPVNAKPVWGVQNERGNMNIITIYGNMVRVDEVKEGTEGAIKGWVPHFKACADAMAAKRIKAEIEAEKKAREEAARLKAMEPKQVSMFGGSRA